ncbi:hypothetical protein [Micromonospora sagamiensis]|uniref:Uncharacterized protein n=1 Tax=Micromonospora sagamiensis TaxID=47875 RepID=A0A562WMZ8_9ACTN|nr:hypothetical protein [Micromonospora sagamiensis]TWJ31565.1 hypothetical protein JD81_05123 [Micromonospora sagamiensis]BCL15382.1 hypothetical protein GCM10017556_31210 [Micromonospora sagamiensis]
MPVEPAVAPTPPYAQVVNVPVESAAWAVSGVADELREAYVAVGAAVVLLERARVSTAHPALREAQRGADHALDLADEATTGEWVRAAGQLELTAAALRETVAALAAQFTTGAPDPAERGRRP